MEFSDLSDQSSKGSDPVLTALTRPASVRTIHHRMKVVRDVGTAGSGWRVVRGEKRGNVENAEQHFEDGAVCDFLHADADAVM